MRYEPNAGNQVGEIKGSPLDFTLIPLFKLGDPLVKSNETIAKAVLHITLLLE